tara:strand:- start:1903 stop:2106 length:204 start_codon:yes stop_codon:yes gene_type:complete
MYQRVLRRPKRQDDGEASVPQGQARQEDGRTFEIRAGVTKPKRKSRRNEAHQKGVQGRSQHQRGGSQ